MPPITVSTEVHRPAAEVYAYATDPSRFAEWQQGVVSGRLVAGDGGGTQARCVTVRRIGFAERASTSDVVRADPPRSWAVRGTDGPIRAAVDVLVEPIAHDRSRLTIRVDFEGHGVGRLLVPLAVRRQAHEEMPANVAVLKARLEGGGGAHPSTAEVHCPARRALRRPRGWPSPRAARHADAGEGQPAGLDLAALAELTPADVAGSPT